MGRETYQRLGVPVSLAPILPLGLGLALALLLQSGLWANAILYLRADVGTLLLLLGVIASLAWAIFLTFKLSTQRRYEQTLTNVRLEQADSHRRFVRRLEH